MQTLRNLALGDVEDLAAALADGMKTEGGRVGLVGELGSGKTVFAKAFLRRLGIKKSASPTFVIAHQYRKGSRLIHHLDLYRLQHERQLTELGIVEMAEGKNISLIEWADKFPSIKKTCDLILKFRVKSGNLRDVTIQFN